LPISFKVGAGKSSITLAEPGRVMAGYAYRQQIATGVVDVELMARAFVMEEDRATGARRLCLVVIDAWACPEPVKTDVLAKLRTLFGNRFNRRNLVISATHTHSGPGGYASYFLYNLTTGGHDRPLLKTMVDGIVAAITIANTALRAGRVYEAHGELAGCGDNRSVAAYRSNPEGLAADAYDRRTDREMTVLRFTHIAGNAETEIGLYSLFAIHPTCMGMYNVEISGDNKGWAAQVCEADKPAGYVAAFANANAGDVSPNVTVAGNWSTFFHVPAGSPDDPAELLADKARMKTAGQKQADKAQALIAAGMTELSGRLDSRCIHSDMSNVRIGNLRTGKAAVGVSFAAGSHEDSIGLATFAVLGSDFDIKPEISEGMNAAAFAAGKSATSAIVGPSVTTAIADVNSLLDVVGATARVTLAGKLDDVRASAPARSWVFGTYAKALFPGEVESHDPQATGATSWEWNVPHQPNWPANYIAAHGQKPVMFPVGIAELKKRRGSSRTIVDAPLVPHVVPLQVIKIGGFVLACVPAEFTTVAGRRLKAKLKSVLGASADHVALAGYSNDYAFYVTTPEEYAAQSYEGAGTLYGPHTLAAYLQEMGKLATALKNGTAVTVGAPVPPPAVFFKI
jgi:neutral ceramidase